MTCLARICCRALTGQVLMHRDELSGGFLAQIFDLHNTTSLNISRIDLLNISLVTDGPVT